MVSKSIFKYQDIRTFLKSFVFSAFFALLRQKTVEIIKMYAEMGGYLVTMGADAHVPNNVFRHADEAEKVVRMLEDYSRQAV